MLAKINSFSRFTFNDHGNRGSNSVIQRSKEKQVFEPNKIYDHKHY